MPIRCGRGVPRPRRACAVPGQRRRRRRGRDRRHRAPADHHPPVGAHDRAPHLPDRRHGLAPHRRVLRRGLRAPTRPRVLGDLRRSRLRPARLAPAAGHRRRPLRRPHRADAATTSSPPHRRLDGSGFFYANPLHQRVPGEAPDPDAENMRAASSLRAPWFHVSCCPTNVARTFASLSGYVATTDDGGVQIHQLMPSTIQRRRRPPPSHHRLPLGRRGRRPRRGDPRVAVAPEPPRPVLGARGRARRPRPPPPGARPATPSSTQPGSRATRSASSSRCAPAGLARTRTSTRSAAASPSSEARSSTASSRPTRTPTCRLSEVVRRRRQRPRRRRRRRRPRRRRRSCARPAAASTADPTDLTFIPYHAWGNRGLSTMRVWVPER